MKIAQGETHVLGSQGITESKGFTIRTNAHAFKMLSSGLYSDKIAAVLREIGCNATDAHIEIGTPDRPIEVKLPNRIDTQFYIKDWGPGLSHDDVMNLYTTYFASTKQTSNDFTGAFGLGSKSPFSYVDSFAVTSVHGGKKRTYSAHLDNSGSPTIALLTTEEVDKDWQHGMMIGFPVKPDDYYEFQQKAQVIYQWFRVTPTIAGAKAVSKLMPTVDEKLFARYPDQGDPLVLMGNVAYPLKHVRDLSKWMFNFNGLVLKAPIGAVQVAASREELQYDPESMKWLRDACNKVTMHIGNEVAKAVNDFAAQDWDGKVAAQGSLNMWGSDHRYTDWESLLVDTGHGTLSADVQCLLTKSIKLPDWAGTCNRFRVMRMGRKGKVEHIVVSGGTYQRTKFHRDAAMVFLEENTQLLYGKAPHALDRVRAAVLEGTIKQAILITPNTKETLSTEARVEAEAEKLRSLLKLKDKVKVDTLPIPPAKLVQRIRGSGKKAATLPFPAGTKLNTNTGAQDPSLFGPADCHFMVMGDGPDQGEYRVFNKNVKEDKWYTRRDWGTIWTSYTELQNHLGITDRTFYTCIRAPQAREFDLLKRGWKSTASVIEEWLKSDAVRNAIADAAAKWRPTVNLYYGANGGWGTALIVGFKDNKPLMDVIAPVLSKAGILEDVEDMYRASVRAKDKAGRNTPVPVQLYDNLRGLFPNLAPIDSVGKRTYATAEDFNEQLHKKYPALNAVSFIELQAMHHEAPTKVPALAELLFT